MVPAQCETGAGKRRPGKPARVSSARRRCLLDLCQQRTIITVMNAKGGRSPLKQFSAGVFGTDDRIVTVNRDTVRELAEAATSEPLKRARLCAHADPQNALHEMVIVLARGTYVRPHRHRAKSESFHVIEGTCDLVLFNDNGEIDRVIPLGAYETGDIFFYRLSDSVYHTVLVNSELFVMHETTNGPFQPGEAEFASWSPPAENQSAACDYMNSLKPRIEAARRDH
jgi:cupin fold WbuC family metalloprotein